MKILHTLNVSFAIPYMLGNQINYFKDKGHEIHIACSPGNNLDSFIESWDFKYLNVVISRKFSLVQDIISLLKLISYIKKNKIDVVVGHTPKGALLSMAASFFSHVPKRIYIVHGLMFETSFGFKRTIFIFIEKLTSYFSSEVICVSNSVLEQAIKYKLSSRSKLKVIKKGTCNGVDALSRFNKKKIDSGKLADIKSKLKISQDDFVVGFVGRLAKDKGIIELLSAWDLIKEKKENFKLILCGPLDERDPINKSVFEKIVADKSIYLVGEVLNAEYYYALFSIFVLPSYREGFPTVVLEASAMELPVITTKSTGCCDSIIESETGIFTTLTSKGISDSIFYFSENPELIPLFGSNGRSFVLKNYQSFDIWLELEKIYCH